MRFFGFKNLSGTGEVNGYFPNFDQRNNIRMLTKIGQGNRGQGIGFSFYSGRSILLLFTEIVKYHMRPVETGR